MERAGNIASILSIIKNYVKSIDCEVVDQQTFKYKLKGKAPIVSEFEIHLTIEIVRGDLLPLLLYRYCARRPP